MGQMRVRRTGPWVKISCPFSWVQFIRCVGHGVGQAVDPHFDPHHFQRFCNKKASKTEVFDAFWSCWADSNCRPHPYQGCALPTELQQRVATTKGLEPSTSGVTGRRSNQLNYMAVYARCRVISTQQIDYSTYNVCCKEFFLAGAERFELSTRGFGDRCSTS